MDIKYSYLGYSLIFLAIWVLFYVLRPDLRRRMFLFSLVMALLGPLSEFWFLKDYWRRLTITGYPISIEEVAFSFAIGALPTESTKSFSIGPPMSTTCYFYSHSNERVPLYERHSCVIASEFSRFVAAQVN
jgi:hypothetical protein